VTNRNFKPDIPHYDSAGSDADYPAACQKCNGPAVRTDDLRPSGHGFMVRCSLGHVTVGKPALDHPIYEERHPEYFAGRRSDIITKKMWQRRYSKEGA